MALNPGPAPGTTAQGRALVVATVANAVCADKQTTVADDPTNDVPSQSESRRHEHTRGHPHSRRQDAGRTEVRLHCRGLTTAGEGLDVDSGQFTGLENGNPDPTACPGDDHTEAAGSAAEPVGQPRRREPVDGMAMAHAERSLGHGHQASGASDMGSIKSSAAPGSSSPATDELKSSGQAAAGCNGSWTVVVATASGFMV